MTTQNTTQQMKQLRYSESSVLPANAVKSVYWNAQPIPWQQARPLAGPCEDLPRRRSQYKARLPLLCSCKQFES